MIKQEAVATLLKQLGLLGLVRLRTAGAATARPCFIRCKNIKRELNPFNFNSNLKKSGQQLNDSHRL